MTIILVAICQGCVFITQKKFVQEYDEVKAVQRTKGIFQYRPSHSLHNPLQSVEQVLLVEKKGGNYAYTFFDKLALNAATFNMEDSVYLLVDELIIPICIENRFRNTEESLTTNEETILALDSTEVTVVTGYEKQSTYYSNISYRVPQQFMESILTAGQVQFRYYSGPHIFTVKPNRWQLARMKKVIGYR